MTLFPSHRFLFREIPSGTPEDYPQITTAKMREEKYDYSYVNEAKFFMIYGNNPENMKQRLDYPVRRMIFYHSMPNLSNENYQEKDWYIASNEQNKQVFNFVVNILKQDGPNKAKEYIEDVKDFIEKAKNELENYLEEYKKGKREKAEYYIGKFSRDKNAQEMVQIFVNVLGEDITNPILKIYGLPEYKVTPLSSSKNKKYSLMAKLPEEK